MGTLRQYAACTCRSPSVSCASCTWCCTCTLLPLLRLLLRMRCNVPADPERHKRHSPSTAAACLTCALSEAESLGSAMQVQWLAKRISAIGFVVAGRKAVHMPHPSHVQRRDQGRAQAVWRGRVHGHPNLLITIGGPQGVRPLVETLCMVTVHVVPISVAVRVSASQSQQPNFCKARATKQGMKRYGQPLAADSLSAVRR
jgi:hypothetical protein